jgi:molecular chaperone Hsp33
MSDDTALEPRADQALRVMTNDHAFRVITATTTASVAEIVRRQKARGPAAEALASLVTSAALLRETMAPELRVQGLLRGAGSRGNLVGDAFPDGGLRGLLQLREGERFSLGEGSLLQMMRHLVSGGLQQGVVDVGRAGGVGEALTGYLHASEQLVCVARVGARFEGDEVVAAGGYIVQLLPEAERPVHMVMTQRLEDFPPIEEWLARDDFTADLLAAELTFGMETTELARSALRFACRCSESALLGALATIDRKDLAEMIEAGEPLEIGCDYCGDQYRIAVERLRSLLVAS